MGERRVKISKMRGLISENLKKSVREIPQAHGFIRVDCTKMLQLQNKLREEGRKVSDSVFLMRAVAEALKEFPQFNSRLEGDEIIYYDSINAGIGTDTKNGLLVVVLKDIQGKPLLKIAGEFNALMDKVKSSKLTMDDISGSTFTISNLSKSRQVAFQSIVSNNECFILGMAGIHKEALVLDDGTISARDVCNVMININHIIVDGMSATSFLERICDFLEHPELCLD